MSFLAYDSPFMTGYRKIVDYMLLGLLWVLACLPVISFGVATTAMLLTAEKCLRKDEGKLLATFWNYFRKEFKEATVLWLIQLPVLAIMVAVIFLLNTFQLSLLLKMLITVVNLAMFCWVQLWFAYLSKFEDNIKTLLYNTFRMTMSSFTGTVLMSVVILTTLTVTVVLILVGSLFVLLVPGVFIMIYTALIRKFFAKYIIQEEIVPVEEAE